MDCGLGTIFRIDGQILDHGKRERGLAVGRYACSHFQRVPRLRTHGVYDTPLQAYGGVRSEMDEHSRPGGTPSHTRLQPNAANPPPSTSPWRSLSRWHFPPQLAIGIWHLPIFRGLPPPDPRPEVPHSSAPAPA